MGQSQAKKKSKIPEQPEYTEDSTSSGDLGENEEKYRTLTEHIPVGIFRSTPGSVGRFIEVNEAMVRMLGYRDKQELLETNVSDIYCHSPDRAGLSAKMSQSGSVRNEELHLKKKDGTPIIVSETAMAVKDEKDNILYFDGIIEDITERKKAQQQVLIQKTYLEILFNSAPEGIVLHGNDDSIVNVNDEFTKMFGYTRDEAIGRPINDLLASEEIRDEAIDISERVMRGERIELETRRKRKDGLLIDVSILGAPIIHDGKQIGDYAIYRDISERKRAEEDLRVQKTYLEQLFNSAPEAIVFHDDNDLVQDVNAEFTRMFGYTREEAIGRPINDLVAPPHLMNEAASYSAKVINGERVEAESQRRRKDGTLIDVSILGAPIFDGDRHIGVYAIYRDITERKRAQEVRIRVREEARMARNIQLNFLPRTNPSIAGYDIAGKSLPAQNVGGDYYDFIRLDGHRLVICLGDVSGNGLAASLVMANLQATIRGQAMFEFDPAKCLERSNKLLYSSTDSRMFISLFYGLLDFRAHTLCYANAGQDLPLLFGGKQTTIEELSEHGQALGLQEQARYRTETLYLTPGSRLVLFTDGIHEAMNEKVQVFGEKRLAGCVRKYGDLQSDLLIEKILSEVHQFMGRSAQRDDMTLVVIRRLG